MPRPFRHRTGRRAGDRRRGPGGRARAPRGLRRRGESDAAPSPPTPASTFSPRERTPERSSGALVAEGIPEASEEAAEILRVESGRPRMGRGMTTETMPAEAGSTRTRRQLHEGPLYRPGDGRAPATTRDVRTGTPLGLASTAPRGGRGGRPRRPGDRADRHSRDLPRAGPIALAVLRREADPGALVAFPSRGGSSGQVVGPAVRARSGSRRGGLGWVPTIELPGVGGDDAGVLGAAHRDARRVGGARRGPAGRATSRTSPARPPRSRSPRASARERFQDLAPTVGSARHRELHGREPLAATRPRFRPSAGRTPPLPPARSSRAA